MTSSKEIRIDEELITLDIQQFRPFVIEKLLLSLVRRHQIRDVKLTDTRFDIKTENHIIHGYSYETNGLQCLSISIERNKNEEYLIKLYYSEDSKYHEMVKGHLSTFDADVLSPLNNVFDDWDHGRLAVISFGHRDAVANLFRYKIAGSQQNKLMIARSKSGFSYAFLDSDMKAFIENRDRGITTNIILRRLDNLRFKSLTVEMPFGPALELFEDAIKAPLEKPPSHYNFTTIQNRPLYIMKSPTRNVWIVVLEIDDKHTKCKSGYMDEEPDPYAVSWNVYNIRTTKIYYFKDLRRYQILRSNDCVDITHLIRE